MTRQFIKLLISHIACNIYIYIYGAAGAFQDDSTALQTRTAGQVEEGQNGTEAAAEIGQREESRRRSSSS